MMSLGSTLEEERRQWVLAFFDGRADDPRPLDQIRVMKGMFLLSRDPRHPVHNWAMYNFEPYDWGPFDSTVYRDLDALQIRALLDASRQRGSSQIRYRLTKEGNEEARAFRTSQRPELVAIVDAARERVVSKPFRDMLEDIYAEFPDSAVNSRLRASQ